VDCYTLDIGHSRTLNAYNLYGWTGAMQNKRAASRTNHLLEAIVDEVDAQPLGPSCIVGDLNGDPDKFKALQDLLTNQGWTDLGANGKIWGRKES